MEVHKGVTRKEAEVGTSEQFNKELNNAQFNLIKRILILIFWQND